MNCRATVLWVGLVCALLITSLFSPLLASAVGAPPLQAPSGLSILEIKMTGDEFVVLQNNTAVPITDLASYWLYAYNKTDPSSPGTTSSGQQLPAGQLDPGQTLLLASKARPSCGAEIVWTLGPSLGDANGFVQIAKQATVGSTVVVTPGDGASWGTDSVTKLVGTVTGKVPSGTADPAGMYYRTATGWQLADLDGANGCQLNVTATPTNSGGAIAALSQAGTQPPASIVSVAGSASADDSAPMLPPADVGLSAPQITELLPNPDGTGTDDTDEFIELYNPNPAPFHLVGFTLQTGTTTKHNYTFADGVILAPQSFTAFYSADTGLTLSNSGGQADLLDPFGNVISQTDAYGTAKDGQSWSLADGKWYWATATPNAANIVKQASASTASKPTTTKSTSGSSAVKGASTTASPSAASSGAGQANGTTPAPIHPYVLAAVAVLAVGYGVYEYRHDLGNRIYQFRRHRAARRAARA